LILAALRRWFPWLQLGWLIFLSPFLLFVTLDQWWWLLGIPFMWLCAWAVVGRPLPRTPLDFPVAVMTVLTLVSLVITPNLNLSLPPAANLFLGVAVYYAIIEVSQVPRGISISMGGLIALGVGIGLLGLLGAQILGKSSLLVSLATQLRQPLGGLSGLAEGFHPNIIAGALLWIMPLALAVSIGLWRSQTGRQRRWNWLTGAATLWMAGIVLISQSRSSWFGLIAGLAGMLGVVNRSARKWLVGFSIMLLLAVMLIGPQLVLMLDSLQSSVGTLNWQFRTEVWRTALQGARDFPFTGFGIGAFPQVSRLLYAVAVSPGVEVPHAHNEFLQAAVDLGAPGLIAWLALYIGSFGMLWQLWHAAPPTNSVVGVRYIVLGLYGGLLAHAAFSLTDAVAFAAKPGFIIWILFGLTSGLFLHDRVPRYQDRERNRTA
jgi:putative inorganic carbon (hco3(-)) transporter